MSRTVKGGKSMKCPISGIDCDECGYYREYSECFLRELMETLTELVNVVRSMSAEEE